MKDGMAGDPHARVLEHLENLIRIPSPSGRENELADYCFDALRGTDFEARKVRTDDGRYVVYAEMKGAKAGKTLLFAGHIDTVPVVDGWETDPFEPVRKLVRNESGEMEERLYGLGSNDMKPGIAQMLAIAERLAGRADSFGGTVSLAFLPDEEAYSLGARTLIGSGLKADFCIMTEPSEREIRVGSPGKMLFRARTHGKAAHGARPQDGINAVLEMGRFLASLDRVPLMDDGEMGKQMFVPFSIKGGPEFYSLSIPYECSCVISKQLVPGESKESVLENLEAYVRTLDLQGHMTFEIEEPYYLPYRVNEHSPEFKLFEDICMKRVGETFPYRIGSSVSDANCLCAEAGIPVLMFGHDGCGNHQKNECVKVESLRYVFDIYMDFLSAYLNI